MYGVCVCPQAIQNPSDMVLQERAWNAVCPLVIRLKKFYAFSIRLGTHPDTERSRCSQLSICTSFKISFVLWRVEVR